jgi:hypothetical protein
MNADRLTNHYHMIKNFILLWIIIFIGCKQMPSIVETKSDSIMAIGTELKDSPYKSYYSLGDMKADKNIDTSLSYRIDTLCAIAILPDTSWINEQQRSMSEDDWNTIVDDQLYYQSLAEDTLEAKGIKIFYRLNDRRYLRFVKNNNREFTIDKQKKRDMWGLILFNGVDDPVIWNDTEFEQALKDIYRK